MKKPVRERAWPLALALFTAVTCTVLYLSSPDFLDLLELKTYDLRLRARGPIPTSELVSIVAIDERSLEEIGRWPWTRSLMADLVKRLDSYDPLGVGYDISFFDPEDNPAQAELLRLAQNAQTLGLLPNPNLLPYIKERLQNSSPDLALAEALASSRDPQILGYYFNLSQDLAPGEHTLDRAERYPAVKVVGGGQPPEVLPIPRATKARTNIRPLAEVAYSQAYFNIIPDRDGTIRRYPLAIGHGNENYLPLAAALAALTDPKAMPALEVASFGVVRSGLGKLSVPTDEHGQMILHYRGPEKTIPHVPAWKILRGEANPDLLRGRYLLVGVTAPAVFDLRVTPFGVAYPGIEIQATALDNMLRGDFMLRPSWAPMFDIAALWVLCLVCGIFLWRLKAAWSILGVLVTGGGFVLANLYLFETRLFWLNLVYPLLALTGSYLILTVYRFMFADRQKRAIRQAFSKYLDPHVVEDVVSDPEKLRLGGVKLELTVLFSDIRGFTTISEGLSPDDLVKLLNEYLTEMTDIVMHNRGLLDKYMGDAVMAVYGAPKHYPEHAEMACRTALEMMARLKELNEIWEPAGWPCLDIGVGINTGSMVAGNMGSQNRFDYTVMGDHVNLGSRLEGLNKVYGTNVIVSEFTRRSIQDKYRIRSLDLVKVKGKDQPVEIFELLAPADSPCPLGYVDRYEEGVADYRKGEFQKAQSIFREIGNEHPGDTVVRLYLERLDHLLANPPESWDGVFTFTTK